MSKTGATLLLTLLFLGLSGNFSKPHAQEKLLKLTSGVPYQKKICTPLQNQFIVSLTTCEDKTFLLTDTAVKAISQSKSENLKVFSYTTEPTYYVESKNKLPVQPAAEEPPKTSAQTADIQTQTVLYNVPAESANLNSDIILDMINAHRTKIGLTPFQKDEALCKLAATRSQELHEELFVNGNLHSGLYNRNLPYWITENAKWGSNEAGTVQWWLHSPIHRRAIEGDYVYSCGACNGTQCSQLFTSYTPKG